MPRARVNRIRCSVAPGSLECSARPPPMSDKPRGALMRRLSIVLGAVLVVLLVAGGSFYGGMAFQRTRQANVQEQFFAQRGFAPGGQLPLSGTPEGVIGERDESGALTAATIQMLSEAP